MDRDALDYLMMMTQEADRPDPTQLRDLRGIVNAFGGLKMRIPEGARMSDNVIDRRGGRTPEEPPFVMPDNVERDPETGQIVWKRESEQPPIPKMFEHDVLRTIFENVPQSYYWMRDDMRDVKPMQDGPALDRDAMQRKIDEVLRQGKSTNRAQLSPLLRLLGLN